MAAAVRQYSLVPRSSNFYSNQIYEGGQGNVFADSGPGNVNSLLEKSLLALLWPLTLLYMHPSAVLATCN